MLKLLIIAALATTATAAGAAEPNKDKRERRICKRDVATGSLVGAKRICLTKDQWKQSEMFNRQTVEEWQEAVDGKQRGG